MSRIAVVGAGISGLAAAWLLSRHHAVTLFESGRALGGHSNTVDATVDGLTAPVDTGFLVYNDRTYPHLIGLFRLLEVESAPSDMSFSVRIGDGQLEWAGTSLASVFAQRTNLVPMAACIWSTPATQINRFPLATFLNFCRNHGLLAVSNRPQWRTVKGGSREYVKKLAAALKDIRLATPVRSVRRYEDRVEIATDGAVERFDQVVLATHTDTTLSLLESPSVEERAILKAIPYQANTAVLHTDERLLPRRRAAWASWNFHAPKPELSDEPVCLTYLINKLQPLPFPRPVMVTMNPVEAPREECVLQSIEYHHPVFLEGSDEAKRRVGALQGRARTWFCGAWTRFGFHEDGLLSAVNVARQMGVPIPWAT